MVRVPLTPDQFAAKEEQLEREKNIKLTGDTGTITDEGYTFAYSYDRANGIFQFECTQAPHDWEKTFAEHKLHGALIAN